MNDHRLARTDDPGDLWAILGRYLAGESDPEEVERVRAWLAENPRRAELLEELDTAVQRHAPVPPADLDVDAALARMHRRMEAGPAAQANRGTRGRRPWTAYPPLRIAAVLAVAVGAGVVWRTVTAPDPSSAIAAGTWATAVGELESLELPDGSRIVLGPDSRLTLGGEFGEGARPVLLDGQARFDVAPDPSRPFMIRTPSGPTVVVLGTTFVVRTAMDRSVRVAVEAGSVRFGAGPFAEGGVVLGGGDRAFLAVGGEPLVEPGGVSESDLAWATGRLVLDDLPMTQVAEELRRWYGVEVSWPDPGIGTRRISASFEGESAAEVLTVVAAVLGVQVEVRGRTAVLYRPSDNMDS